MQDITNNAGESDRERRRYFRIDDDIVMEIRRLDAKHFDEELEHFERRRESFCMLNNAEYDHDLLLGELRSIQANYPEVAKYLTYLEQRLDVLTRTISSQQADEQQPVTHVNISAQGMRFHCDKSFNSDDLIEMRITLLPASRRLLVIGTVVWCVEDPQAIGAHRNAVAVDFTYIHEADREVLAKHIHTRQLQQLGHRHGKD